MFRPLISGNSNRPQSVKPNIPSQPRSRTGSVKQIALVTLGSAAVLAGFYSLSHFGPASYETSAQRANLGKEEADKLRVIAEDAETRWQAIKQKHREAGTPFTEQDLVAIGEAVVTRLQYENQVPGVESRHAELQKDLHDRSAEILRAESVAIEKQALAAEREKNHPLAEARYAEALALEERINNEFGEAASKDIHRTNTLSSRRRVMAARPIWDSSVAHEKAAEQFATEGKIDAAIAHFERARLDNYRLESEFRGLTAADTFRTRRLDRRLSTLRSLILRDQAVAAVTRAEKLAAEQSYDELNALRSKVEDLTHLLGDRFPDSEYAAPEYLRDLKRRAHNAASAPEALAIEKDLVDFRKAVRNGDPAAATRIEGLRRATLRTRELFPLSDRISEALAAEIAYLFEHRTEINLVGNAVRNRTRPIPGRERTLALTGETTQRLYALVMGENPSATRGDDRPVESLTREEAREFCKRLGWLIAAEVALPTREEFLAMAGTPEVATLRKTARLLDNSDGKAERSPAATANAHGFTDLYGNVAEWIESPEVDQGLVAGGDAESTAEQLTKSPFATQPAEERSRFVGFRFVVREAR